MITVREAIEILQKCNPDASIRIYLVDGDCTDAVESIEEDLSQKEVYLYTFPLNEEDVQNRWAEIVEVVNHDGCFRQIKSRPIS